MRNSNKQTKLITYILVGVVAVAGFIGTKTGMFDTVADPNASPGKTFEDFFVADTNSVNVDPSEPLDQNIDIDQLVTGLYNAPEPTGHNEKYDRKEQFGNGWATVDGCTIREHVLMRDLTETTMRTDRDCKVHTGLIEKDAYTGETIHFNSVEDPMAVQIDHILPLSEAWYMGANEWTQEERVEFANDTSNLVASDGPENNRKDNKTPAQWMPANTDFQCQYVYSYSATTIKWGLAIEAPVRDSIIEVLEQC